MSWTFLARSPLRRLRIAGPQIPRPSHPRFSRCLATRTQGTRREKSSTGTSSSGPAVAESRERPPKLQEWQRTRTSRRGKPAQRLRLQFLAPEHHRVAIKTPRTRKVRTGFAVYAPIQAQPDTVPATAPPPNPLPGLHAAQIAKLDRSGRRGWLLDPANPYRLLVGDTVMVSLRRGGEPFAGVVMSVRKRGVDTALLLRNTLTKVGVEMWFKIYNQAVSGIEIVKRRERRARRARLTYLRQPKHDPGPQDKFVRAWRASRTVLTSRSKLKKTKLAEKKEKNKNKKKK